MRKTRECHGGTTGPLAWARTWHTSLFPISLNPWPWFLRCGYRGWSLKPTCSWHEKIRLWFFNKTDLDEVRCSPCKVVGSCWLLSLNLYSYLCLRIWLLDMLQDGWVGGVYWWRVGVYSLGGQAPEITSQTLWDPCYVPSRQGGLPLLLFSIVSL